MKQGPFPRSVPPAGWWLAAPLIHLVLLLGMARPATGEEWWVFLSFLIITSFSSWCLFADRRPYSLNKIWWLFQIVFMGIVPSVQVAVHHMPWKDGDISLDTILKANALILFCLVLYKSIRWGLDKKTAYQLSISYPILNETYLRRYRRWAPPIMAAAGVALLWFYGWKGLLLRGPMEMAGASHNTTLQLVFDKSVRGVMLYLTLAAIWLYRQGHLSRKLLLAILAASFLLNFPLSLPRYLAFTIYLSWLLVAGFSWMQRRHLFTLGVLCLMLLMGPLVSMTRYAGVDMAERLSDPAEVFRKAYLVTDFDAYSSLCRTMQYTAEHGPTGGRQLTGVALFYVPRSVWPTKPVGSGAFLFDQLGFEFKNVSCTFLAEGYINFGWWGSPLFTMLLAVCIFWYDDYYWHGHSPETQLIFARLFYLVALGMLFFILRGDLLSSFAYTVGLFASGFVLHRILFWRQLRQPGRSTFQLL